MPLNADYSCTCDRCGQHEISSSILLFVQVADLEVGSMQAVSRFYCRRNQCSTAIREAGVGAAVSPQTEDLGGSADQTSSDGTFVPPPVVPPPASTVTGDQTGDSSEPDSDSASSASA